MSPKLEAISGPLKGATFYLAEEVSFGHDQGNVVVIPDSSLAGRHCLIKREGLRVSVQSLGGDASILVNGLPVKTRVLRDGDEIKIGDSVFLLILSESRGHQESPSLDDRKLSGGTTLVLKPDEALALKQEEALEMLSPAAPIVRDWNNLLRVCRTISSIRNLEELERHLLALIAEIVPGERGAIFLLGEHAGDFAAVTGWDMRIGVERTVEVSRNVIDRVLREGVAILSNGLAATPGCGDEQSQVRSLLAVPLEVFDRVRGVIYVDTCDAAARFDSGQLRLLAAVGTLAGLALESARRQEWLEAENRRLQAEINVEHDMIGDSTRIRKIYQFIAKVGPQDSTVLISGESGTGKELVARALHRNSRRAAQRFVAINCAALPEALLESELFGYERGAFTGALATKKGKLEMANGGTVFLDEVAELAPPLQAKLLRALQERELERVGGARPIPVDIRLIAASNQDLGTAVKKGTFRLDLFYRLNVVSLTVPPLRERREDLPQLANYFAKKYAAKSRRRVVGISPKAQHCLFHYDWPGNVRELENAIERAVVLGSCEQIMPEDLPEAILDEQDASSAAVTLYHEAMRSAKKQLIVKALQEAGGNYTRAAKALGVHPNYLHRLVRNLNLRADCA